MRRFIYELLESFRIAWTQIRANKMRSMLTALGVIIGIIAVTLMGTAILGIDAGVENSLSGFGDDVLYVTKTPWFDGPDESFRNTPTGSTNGSRPIPAVHSSLRCPPPTQTQQSPAASFA